MASVQMMDKGKWRVRYRSPDGKSRSKTLRTGEQARRFAATLETSISSGEWIAPERAKVTISDWAPTWLPTLHDRRRTTRARTESVVRVHVVPKWGTWQSRAVTHSDVAKWVAELVASGLSAASVRKVAFPFRGMLDAAVADGRIKTNPAAGVRLPVEQQQEQRFLSVSEVNTLADAIDPQYRALVILGAYAGLRFGELAGLRRGRVDVLRSQVEVVETAVDVGGAVSFGPPKTKGSVRRVSIAKSKMREVADHMARYVGPDADALLFTSTSGGPLRRGRFWPGVWKPAIKRAGVDGLRVHDLRHSYVAIMSAAGVPAHEVSKYAGHSSVTFTYSRYGHLYEERFRGSQRPTRRTLNVLFGAVRDRSEHHRIVAAVFPHVS